MKNYILRYALIGGLLLILTSLLNWFLIAPNFSVRASQTFGYLVIILCLLCIPMGIKYFRDNLNEGQVSFGKAFRIGMSITLIVSLVMFFEGMLFFIFQGDVFQEWQLKDLSGDELQEMKARLASMPDFAMKPWFQGVIMFMMILSIGFAMTLLSSFFLRSKVTKG